MSESTGPGGPLLDVPSAFIFTDGAPKRLGRMGTSQYFPGRSGDPSNMGTRLYIPYKTSVARCLSSGPQEHGGTQRLLSHPGLDAEAA